MTETASRLTPVRDLEALRALFHQPSEYPPDHIFPDGGGPYVHTPVWSEPTEEHWEYTGPSGEHRAWRNRNPLCRCPLHVEVATLNRRLDELELIYPMPLQGQLRHP